MSVQLPKEFVKLSHYEGYFVNTIDGGVYSIKSGELRPLKKSKPSYFNKQFSGWILSIGGRKTGVPDIFVERLMKSVNMDAVELINVGQRRIRTIKK